MVHVVAGDGLALVALDALAFRDLEEFGEHVVEDRHLRPTVSA